MVGGDRRSPPFKEKGGGKGGAKEVNHGGQGGGGASLYEQMVAKARLAEIEANRIAQEKGIFQFRQGESSKARIDVLLALGAAPTEACERHIDDMLEEELHFPPSPHGTEPPLDGMVLNSHEIQGEQIQISGSTTNLEVCNSNGVNPLVSSPLQMLGDDVVDHNYVNGDMCMEDVAPSSCQQIQKSACAGDVRSNATATSDLNCRPIPLSNSLAQIFKGTTSTKAHSPSNFRAANSVNHASKDFLHNQGSSQHSKQQNSAPNVWVKRAPQKLSKLQFFEDHTHDGFSVAIDKSDIQLNRLKLENALVGKILGDPVSATYLKSELQRRWAQWGSTQLTMVSKDSFIATFDSADARDEVLMGGPWFIAGQLIGLDRWTANYNSDSVQGISAPTWIRLLKLPLIYWDCNSLSRIGSMIGVPMWVDEVTLNWERAEYARICVRIDFSKRLPNGIWIDGIDGKFFQPLAYEGITQLCFKCGLVGHKESSCKAANSQPKTTAVQSQQQQFSAPGQNKSPLPNCASQCPAPFDGTMGSWADHVDQEQLLMGMGKDPLMQQLENGQVLKKTAAIPPTSSLDKGMGEWVLVTRKQRKARPRNLPHVKPNNSSLDDDISANPYDLPTAKQHAQMQNSALSAADFLHKKQHLNNLGGAMKQVDETLDPSLSLERFVHKEMAEKPEKVAVVEEHKGKRVVSWKPKQQKERVSKSHFEKEILHLGPIAAAAKRKRSKNSNTFDDGGDASPMGIG